MLRSIPCLFSSVLHFNLPSVITANQLLISIPCFKCVVLLLDIFNNYLRLRSTTTPTDRLHGCSGFRFICCVVNSVTVGCRFRYFYSAKVMQSSFKCSGSFAQMRCIIVNSLQYFDGLKFASRHSKYNRRCQ
jgi:hypothetical protein